MGCIGNGEDQLNSAYVPSLRFLQEEEKETGETENDNPVQSNLQFSTLAPNASYRHFHQNRFQGDSPCDIYLDITKQRGGLGYYGKCLLLLLLLYCTSGDLS